MGTILNKASGIPSELSEEFNTSRFFHILTLRVKNQLLLSAKLKDMSWQWKQSYWIVVNMTMAENSSFDIDWDIQKISLNILRAKLFEYLIPQ